MKPRLAAAAAIALLGGVGAWQGVRALQQDENETPALPLGNGADASDEDSGDATSTPARSATPPLPR